MPTITCRDCNRYVEVPNITGSEFFKCPTCPPTVPRKLLYKCTACMKVSMLPQGAKVCPKCSTMVRPTVRQLLTPIVYVPALPQEWVYHTTNIEIANSIKRDGLIPTFLRTNNDTAHPKGAFIRNREKRLATPMETVKSTHPIFYKVKEGLAYLISLGDLIGLHNISNIAAVPMPINFAPNGGSTDAENLGTACNAALQGLAIQLGYVAAPADISKAPNYFKNWRDGLVIAKALQIAKMPGHFLTIWAREYVKHYYRIEEMKTARHVYFIKHKYAEDCYREYTAGVSKATIVVLRVRKASIPNLIDDQSEFKAECTPDPVLPNIIEIFVPLNQDTFTHQVERENTANWIAIGHWGA